jgi:hypothetical protein
MKASRGNSWEEVYANHGAPTLLNTASMMLQWKEYNDRQ